MVFELVACLILGFVLGLYSGNKGFRQAINKLFYQNEPEKKTKKKKKKKKKNK